jgi:hypothetical protein
MNPAHGRRPRHLPELAAECLGELARAGLGACISLGGATGLLHYLDYRPTNDVDAWWTPSASPTDRDNVIRLVEECLARHGNVRIRRWGDVVSLEVTIQDQTVFGFQVAARSVALGSPASAGWVDVWLDSLDDILASKMMALVERGAPRDLRDIHAVCMAGLATPQQCWQLWRRRQELAGSDSDSGRARLAVQSHLARIAQHRPLESIGDAEQRSQATQLRQWVAKDFLDAIPG